MIRGYRIAFEGVNPPNWHQLCSMLEQGREYDQYDAGFVIQELPADEAGQMVEPEPRERR